MGIIINHYKDPYSTTRIHWKGKARFFFMALDVSSPPDLGPAAVEDPLMLCVRAGTLEMLHFLGEQKYIEPKLGGETSNNFLGILTPKICGER